SLRRRGGRLVVRAGAVAREVGAVAAECGATEVHMAAGVTSYAHHREERLRERLGAGGVALRVHETVITAVAPGAVTPVGSDHFAVFTPYARRWDRERLREPLSAPGSVPVPDAVRGLPLPARAEVPGPTPSLPAVGQTS